MKKPSQVRVFVSGDPGLLALAKSLLQAERIDYIARNEMGFAATTDSGSGRAAELWVRSADANTSRIILKDLTDPSHD